MDVGRWIARAVVAVLVAGLWAPVAARADEPVQPPGQVHDLKILYRQASSVFAGSSDYCITWEMPADDGGSRVTSYLVTTNGHQLDKSHSVNRQQQHSCGGGVPGTQMEISVQAVNEAGLVGPAATIEFELIALPPSAPEVSSVPSARGGKSTVRVAWRAHKRSGGAATKRFDVRAYRVKVRDGERSYREVRAKRLPAARRAVTMQLKRGRYVVAVRAVNSGGPGDWAVTRPIRAR